MSASYKQNGSSMVVHSFINSIEPPGSADMSQIPINRCGKFGDPKLRYLLKIELKDYKIRSFK